MRVLKCTSCDLLLHEITVSADSNAYCPRCGTRVIKTTSLSDSGELALCLASMILFFPAQIYALISIELFSVDIYASVTNGSLAIGTLFPFVASLIIFCTTIAPLFYLLSILGAHLFVKLKNTRGLFLTTWLIKQLRHWVMIDVFFVSLGIASFKVIEVAPITADSGLLSFILLQVLMGVLLSRVSPKRYWAKLRSHDVHVPRYALTGELTQEEINRQFLTCSMCTYTQDSANKRCIRCGAKVAYRRHHSVQKTWAMLLIAIICIFPANLLPISVLVANGRQLDDTIFSGVSMLVNQGMYGIALIIFTASIIVPVAKIIFLLYLLISIQLKMRRGRKQRMKIYRLVHWIGKWSMVDLCVIAIMVSLLDRGNLVDFTPGPGAVAFGLVVIFTMIATELLDPRLIWDRPENDR